MPGPFERYAHEAPSDVMRELARVAAARNLSQEALARDFAEAAGVEINGGNVSRHFKSINPRPETVESYRRALRIQAAHLRLLDPKPLSAAEKRSWRMHLERDLKARLRNQEAARSALGAFTKLTDADQERALRDYALTELRDAAGAAGPWFDGMPPALAAFQNAVSHAYDLAPNLRKPSQRDDVLKSMWLRARAAGFSEAQSETLVTIARSFAIENGLDVATLDERLTEARKPSTTSYFALRAALSEPKEKR